MHFCTAQAAMGSLFEGLTVGGFSSRRMELRTQRYANLTVSGLARVAGVNAAATISAVDGVNLQNWSPNWDSVAREAQQAAPPGTLLVHHPVQLTKPTTINGVLVEEGAQQPVGRVPKVPALASLS